MNWTGRYYGEGARKYEEARSNSLRWAKEQVAVDAFISRGPVLDVPVGTGRYYEIYKRQGLEVIGVDSSPDMLAATKRLRPEFNAQQGDIFSLPFKDKSFGTVVCTRMLDWFRPSEMERAMAEIKRVGHELIVSIRYGTPDWQINQTHDYCHFLEQLDGLHIAGRLLTEEGPYGIEEVFHLRPAVWDDVLEQFKFHGNTPAFEMQRLARHWIKDAHLCKAGGSQQPGDISLKAEYWLVDDLERVIAGMAAEYDSGLPDHERYKTQYPPRVDAGPVTLFTSNDRTIVLDGRRRINRWHSLQEIRKPVLHLYDNR